MLQTLPLLHPLNCQESQQQDDGKQPHQFLQYTYQDVDELVLILPELQYPLHCIAEDLE